MSWNGNTTFGIGCADWRRDNRTTSLQPEVARTFQAGSTEHTIKGGYEYRLFEILDGSFFSNPDSDNIVDVFDPANDQNPINLAAEPRTDQAGVTHERSVYALWTNSLYTIEQQDISTADPDNTEDKDFVVSPRLGAYQRLRVGARRRRHRTAFVSPVALR